MSIESYKKQLEQQKLETSVEKPKTGKEALDDFNAKFEIFKAQRERKEITDKVETSVEKPKTGKESLDDFNAKFEIFKAQREGKETTNKVETSAEKPKTGKDALDIVKRQSEIQELFNEEQLKVNSDHVLDANGMNEWVNPYENQPRNLAIGNYAHENAEKFIAELPEGLDSERTVSSDNGTVRLDRTDWNGNIIEIKPETDDAVNRSAYQNQVDKQVKIFQGAFPERGEQTGRIVTYNPEKVEQEMIDKGLLSPSQKTDESKIFKKVPDITQKGGKDIEVDKKNIDKKEDNKKEDDKKENKNKLKNPKNTVSAQPYTDDPERFLR